jgi:hypothetical protein
MNLGDKIVRFRNPEDVMTAYTMEVTDVFEVGPNETYVEITEKDVKELCSSSKLGPG